MRIEPRAQHREARLRELCLQLGALRLQLGRPRTQLGTLRLQLARLGLELRGLALALVEPSPHLERDRHDEDAEELDDLLAIPPAHVPERDPRADLRAATRRHGKEQPVHGERHHRHDHADAQSERDDERHAAKAGVSVPVHPRREPEDGGREQRPHVGVEQRDREQADWHRSPIADGASAQLDAWNAPTRVQTAKLRRSARVPIVPAAEMPCERQPAPKDRPTPTAGAMCELTVRCLRRAVRNMRAEPTTRSRWGTLPRW